MSAAAAVAKNGASSAIATPKAIAAAGSTKIGVRDARYTGVNRETTNAPPSTRTTVVSANATPRAASRGSARRNRIRTIASAASTGVARSPQKETPVSRSPAVGVDIHVRAGSAAVRLMTGHHVAP